MLEHFIAPYKEEHKVYQPDYSHRRHHGHGQLPYNYTVNLPTPNTQKIVYGMWLGRLAFKRGDYCVNKTAPYPYEEDAMLRVVQLQEVHMLCTFDDKDRPLAMEVVTRHGTRFWTCPVDYTRVWTPTAAMAFDLPMP